MAVHVFHYKKAYVGITHRYLCLRAMPIKNKSDVDDDLYDRIRQQIYNVKFMLWSKKYDMENMFD
jgi:hypothetical protein